MKRNLITQKKVIEITELLSDYFEIAKPRIYFHSRRQYGSAGIKRGQAHIRLPSCLTFEDEVIHEFTHVLQFDRLSIDRTSDLRSPHGQTFKDCLLKVVEVWYSKIEDYCWSREYKTIQKWYQGLSFEREEGK